MQAAQVTSATQPISLRGLPARWLNGGAGVVRAGPLSLLLAAMYVLTIIGFPLASTIPAILNLDSQVATVPYRVLVLVLALAVVFGWWVRGTRVVLNAGVMMTLTLWALLVARMFHDIASVPFPGDLYAEPSQLLLLSLGACFIPAITALELPSERTLEFARRAMEVLGAVAMLGMLYAGLREVMQGSILYRLATPVLNPISVGHVGVSVLIVTLCGFAGSGGMARLLRALLATLSVIVVVATVSRGPIAAALVTSMLFALRPRPGRSIGLGGVVLRLLLIGSGVAAVVQAINYLEAAGIIDVIARLTDTLQDVAAQDRMAMILGAWQQFTENPVLGNAMVERRFMENPHNIVIESLMALGVVGLGLLLVVLWTSGMAALSLLRVAPRHAWVGLIYVQYVINAMLSGSLFTDSAFWFFGLSVLAVTATLTPRAEA